MEEDLNLFEIEQDFINEYKAWQDYNVCKEAGSTSTGIGCGRPRTVWKHLKLKLHPDTIKNMQAIALSQGFVTKQGDRKGEPSISAWLNALYRSKTMLSPESLNQIKQVQSTNSPEVIHIEIGNGFQYGSVTVGSAGNKQVIQDISNELGWTFREGGCLLPHMMYRTGQKFKDADSAIRIAEIIKADLESKGFDVKAETKAYR